MASAEDRPQNPLFTVGYAGQTFESLLELLSHHRIEAIADVRSQPWKPASWPATAGMEPTCSCREKRFWRPPTPGGKQR